MSAVGDSDRLSVERVLCRSRRKSVQPPEQIEHCSIRASRHSKDDDRADRGRHDLPEGRPRDDQYGPGPSFSWVLVWKFSRFARNMEEGLVYRALLRKRGIDILSYKEPVPEGPLGSLITHILMAVDESAGL